MTVPGLVTVLHPNWEKSPISAPNFFRLVGRKSSFPTFIAPPDEFIESIVIPQPTSYNYPPLNFQINPQEEDDDSLPELDEADLEDDDNLPDLDDPDEIPAGLPSVQIPQNFNMVLQITGNTYGYDPNTGGMQLMDEQNNVLSSINGSQPPNLSINNQQQIMEMFILLWQI